MLNKVVESATALIDNQCQLAQHGFAKYPGEEYWFRKEGEANGNSSR